MSVTLKIWIKIGSCCYFSNTHTHAKLLLLGPDVCSQDVIIHFVMVVHTHVHLLLNTVAVIELCLKCLQLYFSSETWRICCCWRLQLKCCRLFRTTSGGLCFWYVLYHYLAFSPSVPVCDIIMACSINLPQYRCCYFFLHNLEKTGLYKY